MNTSICSRRCLLLATLCGFLAAWAGVLPWSARANTLTLNPEADALTFSVYQDLAFGANNVLEVYRSAQNDTMWSFLRFDLQNPPGSIPSGSVITSAALQLYLSSVSGQGSLSVPLYSLNQSWSESSITWSNQPPPNTPFTTTTAWRKHPS